MIHSWILSTCQWVPLMTSGDAKEDDWPALNESATSHRSGSCNWRPARYNGQSTQATYIIWEYSTDNRTIWEEGQCHFYKIARKTEKIECCLTKLSYPAKQDQDFLQINNKKNSVMNSDSRAQHDKSKTKRNTKQKKSGRFTSTPSKNNRLVGQKNALNLSPTQIKAMKYLGWNPSSDFVNNIAALQSQHVWLIKP